MKSGGVDPGVIRELSGIYKPFANAFKELVSNAYDADADLVEIRLIDDSCDLQITDDGCGMTPFEFRNDFTKVGGSYAKLLNERTPKGRVKIGSKGIGFLAVARYSSAMEIVSKTVRYHHSRFRCRPERGRIDLVRQFEVPLSREMAADRLSVKSVTLINERRRKRLGRTEYEFDAEGVIRLLCPLERSLSREVEVEYALDCRKLKFRAVIDFDHLLSLENKSDLEEIEDFCTMDICELSKDDPEANQHFTIITLRGLNDFVVRELKASRKSGNVRNIESRSGTDRFLWQLRRSIPVEYDLPFAIRKKFGKDNVESRRINHIRSVTFSGLGESEVELKRPLWCGEPGLNVEIEDDISAEVKIERDGLVARGYILGHTEVIYPAEYRGVAVRVRNVQIGSPHFFGVEYTATGAAKAALSQITGEINVLKGLDAVDALNPGRESFYEENRHFKLLKKYIVGDGEGIGGLLGKVIKGILTRTQVTSAANDIVQRANQRRKALLSLSMAINQYGTSSDYQHALREVFCERAISANGLIERERHETRPSTKVPGFAVETRDDLEDDFLADFMKRKIYVNPNHDRWSWMVFALGEHFEVVPQIGTELDGLCQLDTREKKIYINWGHPIRQQMGDAAFMKSSIAWTLAYHVSDGRIDEMMDLALRILSYDGA